MGFTDLRDFLKKIESAGMLKRISAEVNPELEMAEIADRAIKQGGPALLFEKPKGSIFPVLMNLFGTMERTCMALGVNSIDEIATRIRAILDEKPPETIIEKIKMLPKLKEFSDYLPKTVKGGQCQEVVMDPLSLHRLPILKTWPKDGGRFITLPLVTTKSPLTGIRNTGMYRMQIFDEVTTGMHWHWHKGGAKHYYDAEKQGKRLEVAVAIGSDPATIYAATAPLPEDFDEFIFAGFLRRKPVELTKCLTVDLEVPANAEFIIEGYVNPGERRKEGPFGDHTGYYSLADDYPVFHVTAITHRKNPIYPATIVGKPPMEDCYLGKATERIFLPVLKKVFPEIIDINLPIEGIFHNFAFISIEKRYPGHSQKIMNSIWGTGQLMFTKNIVVFDSNVNVHDIGEVLWRWGNNVDPARDITIVKGPLDVLEHASDIPGFGGKMGIDATRKRKEDGFKREWPEDIKMDPEISDLVTRRWKDYGL
ncbi:MAG TPA: menaquinone biosynthesis decarboxylase [bacterium]